jgi:hypothetical protein
MNESSVRNAWRTYGKASTKPMENLRNLIIVCNTSPAYFCPIVTWLHYSLIDKQGLWISPRTRRFKNTTVFFFNSSLIQEQ